MLTEKWLCNLRALNEFPGKSGGAKLLARGFIQTGGRDFLGTVDLSRRRRANLGAVNVSGTEGVNCVGAALLGRGSAYNCAVNLFFEKCIGPGTNPLPDPEPNSPYLSWGKGRLRIDFGIWWNIAMIQIQSV